jgi:hypothetical protein
VNVSSEAGSFPLFASAMRFCCSAVVWDHLRLVSRYQASISGDCLAQSGMAGSDEAQPAEMAVSPIQIHARFRTVDNLRGSGPRRGYNLRATSASCNLSISSRYPQRATRT